MVRRGDRGGCAARADTGSHPAGQQRFYDFGFGIKQIDGRLSNETVQGLIAFQKWAGLPETGQLTKLTLQKIDATEAPPA